MTIIYLLAGSAPLLAFGFSLDLALKRFADLKAKFTKTPPAA